LNIWWFDQRNFNKLKVMQKMYNQIVCFISFCIRINLHVTKIKKKVFFSCPSYTYIKSIVPINPGHLNIWWFDQRIEHTTSVAIGCRCRNKSYPTTIRLLPLKPYINLVNLTSKSPSKASSTSTGYEKKQILVYYIDHRFYIHKSLEGFLASTIYW
jgi:hypothetical protein